MIENIWNYTGCQVEWRRCIIVLKINVTARCNELLGNGSVSVHDCHEERRFLIL